MRLSANGGAFPSDPASHGSDHGGPGLVDQPERTQQASLNVPLDSLIKAAERELCAIERELKFCQQHGALTRSRSRQGSPENGHGGSRSRSFGGSVGPDLDPFILGQGIGGSGAEGDAPPLWTTYTLEDGQQKKRFNADPAASDSMGRIATCMQNALALLRSAEPLAIASREEKGGTGTVSDEKQPSMPQLTSSRSSPRAENASRGSLERALATEADPAITLAHHDISEADMFNLARRIQKRCVEVTRRNYLLTLEACRLLRHKNLYVNLTGELRYAIAEPGRRQEGSRRLSNPQQFLLRQYYRCWLSRTAFNAIQRRKLRHQRTLSITMQSVERLSQWRLMSGAYRSLYQYRVEQQEVRRRVELQEARERLAAAEDNAERLEAEALATNEAVKQLLQEMEDEHAEKVAELDATIDNSRAENARLQEEVQLLKDHIAELDAKNQEWMESNATLFARNNSLQEEVDHGTMEQDRLRDLLSAERARVHKLQTLLDSVQADLATSNSVAGQLLSQNKTYQSLANRRKDNLRERAEAMEANQKRVRTTTSLLRWTTAVLAKATQTKEAQRHSADNPLSDLGLAEGGRQLKVASPDCPVRESTLPGPLDASNSFGRSGERLWSPPATQEVLLLLVQRQYAARHGERCRIAAIFHHWIQFAHLQRLRKEISKLHSRLSNALHSGFAEREELLAEMDRTVSECQVKVQEVLGQGVTPRDQALSTMAQGGSFHRSDSLASHNSPYARRRLTRMSSVLSEQDFELREQELEATRRRVLGEISPTRQSFSAQPLPPAGASSADTSLLSVPPEKSPLKGKDNIGAGLSFSNPAATQILSEPVSPSTERERPRSDGIWPHPPFLAFSTQSPTADAATAELQELRTKLSEAEGQLLEANKRLTDVERTRALDIELAVQTATKEAKLQLMKLEVELARMTAKSEELQIALDKKATQVPVSPPLSVKDLEEYRLLESTLSLTRTKVSELEQERDQLKSKIAAQDQVASQQLGSNEKLLLGVQGERDSAVQHLREVLAEKEEQLNDALDSLHHLQQENADLRKSSFQTHSLMNAKDEEIRTLKNQIQRLSSELEDEYAANLRRASQAELRIKFLEQDAVARDGKAKKLLQTVQNELQAAKREIAILKEVTAEQDVEEERVRRSSPPQDVQDELRAWSARVAALSTKTDERIQQNEKVYGEAERGLSDTARIHLEYRRAEIERTMGLGLGRDSRSSSIQGTPASSRTPSTVGYREVDSEPEAHPHRSPPRSLIDHSSPLPASNPSRPPSASSTKPPIAPRRPQGSVEDPLDPEAL